jgi:ribonucleoside-triphosphate reductase (thioredoxin)
VAGATPGLHFPESRFYIRRVRLSKTSDLIVPLVAAGYPVEEAVGDPKTVVVEIPVDVGASVRTLDTVSMWEQLGLAALLQAHWADNQVLFQTHIYISTNHIVFRLVVPLPLTLKKKDLS